MFVAVDTRSAGCRRHSHARLKSKLVRRLQLKAFFFFFPIAKFVSLRHYSASRELFDGFLTACGPPYSACSSVLNGGSSSLMALRVNDSIKDLTEHRQDPLHHAPRLLALELGLG